jgi:hypothetical protein
MNHQLFALMPSDATHYVTDHGPWRKLNGDDEYSAKDAAGWVYTGDAESPKKAQYHEIPTRELEMNRVAGLPDEVFFHLIQNAQAWIVETIDKQGRDHHFTVDELTERRRIRQLIGLI